METLESNLIIDDQNANHSSPENENASSFEIPAPSHKSKSARKWTSGNFDVIEVFDDETQLQDWLNTQGGDWITECKRETRTHHVTEMICRFSHKYSGKRVTDTPYNCIARLRIRRPLTSEMDQSIMVEKTAADHDHEPKDEPKEGSFKSEQSSVRSASAENSRESNSRSDNARKSNEHSAADKICEYAEFELGDEPATASTSTSQETQKIRDNSHEISPELKEIIKEKAALGWDAKKIQNLLMAERMNAPTIPEICALVRVYAKEAEKTKLMEILAKKKAADQKVNEFADKVSQLGSEMAETFQKKSMEEEEELSEEALQETLNETLEEIERKVVEDETEERKVENEVDIRNDVEMGTSAEGEEKEQEEKEEETIVKEENSNEDQQEQEDQQNQREEAMEQEQNLDVKKSTEPADHSEAESNADIPPNLSYQYQGKETDDDMQTSILRPKRNRMRRLYSPSPPPRLGGEPKRKKEKTEELSPSPGPQSLIGGKKFLWAKEPPRQSHSENIHHQHIVPIYAHATREKVKASTASLSLVMAPTPIKFKPMSSSNTSTSSYATHTQSMTVPATPNLINMMRQNDTLARELTQLKRMNQEQQQQVQALISANKELIWAFNESRRQQEELMAQLQLLTGTSGHRLPNGGLRQQQQHHHRIGAQHIAAAATARPNARSGGTKRKQFTEGERQQPPKPRRRERLSMLVPANVPLPPSLAMLNKPHNQYKSPQQQQQFAMGATTSSNCLQSPTAIGDASLQQHQGKNSSANEQLLANVKKEVEEHGRDGGLDELDGEPESEIQQLGKTTVKKLTKEEEVDKIKQRLENLPTTASPDIDKLLGQRRPAIYTPKEHGDWHMVVSGDLRKQVIFQLFQALCPEFNQKSIEEYLKAYPSRGEYIKNSINFAFKTENDLFVEAASKEAYLQSISTKVFSLLEAHNRYSDGSNGRGGDGAQSKRRLADVLKPKRSFRALEGEEED